MRGMGAKVWVTFLLFQFVKSYDVWKPKNLHVLLNKMHTLIKISRIKNGETLAHVKTVN